MTLDDWNTLFQFLSVLLLALTFAVGAGAVVTGYLVNKRQGERIATATAEASTANATAARLDIEAAEARRRQADAEKALEVERIARLKIEARLAPRMLDGDQVKRIAAALAKFPNQTINLAAPSDDSEIVNIANAVLGCFAAAGWKAGTIIGTDLSRSVKGMVVEVEATAGAPVKAAAAALVSALQAEGLAISGPIEMQPRGAGMFSGNPLPNAQMKITVGKK